MSIPRIGPPGGMPDLLTLSDGQIRGGVRWELEE